MFITKLIEGKEIIDKDLENELYKICEREHSGCFLVTNNECPIYAKVLTDEVKDGCECPYFKDGAKMLKALRRKHE